MLDDAIPTPGLHAPGGGGGGGVADDNGSNGSPDGVDYSDTYGATDGADGEGANGASNEAATSPAGDAAGDASDVAGDATATPLKSLQIEVGIPFCFFFAHAVFFHANSPSHSFVLTFFGTRILWSSHAPLSALCPSFKFRMPFIAL
jgi:hypothetical protein